MKKNTRQRLPRRISPGQPDRIEPLEAVELRLVIDRVVQIETVDEERGAYPGGIS